MQVEVGLKAVLLGKSRAMTKANDSQSTESKKAREPLKYKDSRAFKALSRKNSSQKFRL